MVMLTPEIVRWLSSKLKPKSCDYIVSRGKDVIPCVEGKILSKKR